LRDERTRGRTADTRISRKLRTHRAREVSGQLRRVIDLRTEPLFPCLVLDDEETPWGNQKKKFRILDMRHDAARVGAGIISRTVLTIRAGGVLRLVLGTRQREAGMQWLPAGHQKHSQQANDPHLPEENILHAVDVVDLWKFVNSDSAPDAAGCAGGGNLPGNPLAW